MTTTIKTLKRLFGLEPRISREQAMAAFGRRYASFNELLQSNADLAAILAKLDAAQRGDKHLETHQVRRIARKAVFHCERMAACLNDMSRNRYKDLEKSVAAIGRHIENELEKHTRGDVNALILPLTEVDASMGYSVGGKNANLGELSNMLDMPVPPGFAVTIQASSLALLRPSGLFKKIHSTLCKVDADVPHSLQDAARTVQNLILEAPLPEEVEKALLDGWDEAFGKDSQVQAALRSSAVDEDGVQSFAGQYLSILGVTRESLRRQYGMVLQDTWLKTASVRENIRLAKPDATDAEVEAAARMAHADSFIRRLPEGYDTVLSDTGGALSAGQRQLLCIARVMLCLPPMLILDEATSSIDTRTEMKISDAFDTLMKGRTSFVVAHRLSTVRTADTILVMNAGRIVEQGTHAQLLAKKGFYYDLYNSQFS